MTLRPASPWRPYETDEFPPDCEVSSETISKALVEFLDTGKRSLSVVWQQGDDSEY
ncbi:hypothetical protein FNH05_00165 [Amycolatopsis rhizosphaerae]|uniref:Uncharacterized protein n=1 Tax=Amycolatopsis rhizosphaerae TaxID=2053003 RepID=A0A558DPN0_9PSEU|nr:Imm1 family immunity protein [Amycolatopsis rhizosphaerae]TVT62957.1 hypothetical protein FNH05_00165 [Amycolatopsis rhizosphaerae]